MTDEEKAEEYRKANYDLTSSPLKELVERCYLDGLAEGRKEANEGNFKEAYQKYVNNSLATFDMKKDLEDARDQIRIAKENTDLEKTVEELQLNLKSRNDLVEELTMQIENYKLSENESKEIIAELKAQIEKMKCCGNCDNNAYCEKEHYGNDKGCEDWKKAE